MRLRCVWSSLRFSFSLFKPRFLARKPLPQAIGVRCYGDQLAILSLGLTLQRKHLCLHRPHFGGNLPLLFQHCRQFRARRKGSVARGQVGREGPGLGNRGLRPPGTCVLLRMA